MGRRHVQMESNRNIDGVSCTERYVVTSEQRGAERSHSKRRRNDETPEHADSRRLAQRELQLRRRYLETVEQTDARRAVDRSRSQRRRNAETTEQTHCRRTADRSRFQRGRRVQKSAMQTFEAALIDIDSEACKSAETLVFGCTQLWNVFCEM